MRYFMATVYACMAPGLEEVECLAAVDVMRRCGIEVILASLGDQKSVTGSHGITVEADEMFDGARCRQADMIFLPGGMPGTTNLMNHEGLRAALLDFHKTEGKRLAAICAAP
ncbi:MAG: DJ-1/PfpI family protein, partial [Verrucomicrobia bacterium]|nr:DJ-1/PfpI family protein [Verrucomicrobiota bacterium]